MIRKIKPQSGRVRRTCSLARAGIFAMIMMGATVQAAGSEAQSNKLQAPIEYSATDTSNQINGFIPFRYAQYTGSTFLPLSTDAEYAYKGSGCIYKTGGTDKLFAHKVLLPEGAVIHYVRMYSFDANTSNSIRGFLTTYDTTGGFSELYSSSSVDGGYGSVLSPLLNYTVDTYTKPINVVVNLGNTTTSDLAFCGVRIAYKLPDLIFKNGFD